MKTPFVFQIDLLHLFSDHNPVVVVCSSSEATMIRIVKHHIILKG